MWLAVEADARPFRFLLIDLNVEINRKAILFQTLFKGFGQGHIVFNHQDPHSRYFKLNLFDCIVLHKNELLMKSKKRPI